eukprot:1559858-Amphidinium_carterae.1
MPCVEEALRSTSVRAAKEAVSKVSHEANRPLTYTVQGPPCDLSKMQHVGWLLAQVVRLTCGARALKAKAKAIASWGG